MGKPQCRTFPIPDLKCLLAGTPIGGVAKALDKPWQAATAVFAKTVAATPLRGLGAVLQSASVGNEKKFTADALRAVTDLAGVIPGVGTAIQAGGNLAAGMLEDAGNAAKAAGGARSVQALMAATIPAAGVPLPPKNMFAQQQAATVNVPQIAAPPPAAGVAQVLANSMSAAVTGGVPQGKRPARTFTPTQWQTHTDQAGSVGGTQVWGAQ